MNISDVTLLPTDKLFFCQVAGCGNAAVWDATVHCTVDFEVTLCAECATDLQAEPTWTPPKLPEHA